MSPYQLRNEDFISKVQVVCPRCRANSVVLGGQPYGNITEYEADVRFSCTTCGFTLKYANTPKFSIHTNSRGQELKARILIQNAPYDPFFGFDLWYRIDTVYGVLWAYNLEHLNVIEHYIIDTQRSRNGFPHQNNSIASRLPQWAKDAKNRAYLIKRIERLKVL